MLEVLTFFFSKFPISHTPTSSTMQLRSNDQSTAEFHISSAGEFDLQKLSLDKSSVYVFFGDKKALSLLLL